jgi:hypothetical protein
MADDPLVINIISRAEHKTNLIQWLNKLVSQINFQKIKSHYFENIYFLKNKISDEIEKEIELSCIEFPRFYFLPREKLIETLSYSRDCRKYFETVKYCFPGIIDLVYALPPKIKNENEEQTSLNKDNEGQKNNDLNSQLEFDINGKLY